MSLLLYDASNEGSRGVALDVSTPAQACEATLIAPDVMS
jgi:hypothetical protein